MKHFYNIVSCIFLFLLLSIETMTQAQAVSIQKNDDGSIDKEILLQEFESFLDSQSKIPQTDAEGLLLIRSFLDNLEFFDDNIGA